MGRIMWHSRPRLCGGPVGPPYWLTMAPGELPPDYDGNMVTQKRRDHATHYNRRSVSMNMPVSW
jgi:hypothetical protein